MIGIDVLEPARLEDRLARSPGLGGQLFTAAELSYCEAQAFPSQHLAARFCAKEAVVKALRIDGFDPLDIEVLGRDGPPHLRLHGEVLRRADLLGVDVTVSLSHLPAVAVAVAVALPRGMAQGSLPAS